MKKLSIIIALLSIGMSVCAQRNKNISVEALGAQNIAGINYDMRFCGNSGFGFRVGVGFGYYTSNDFFLPTSVCEPGVAFPIEVNYLLGRGNHKLELGLGSSLGCYWVDKLKGMDFYAGPGMPARSAHYDYANFGYMMFANIGYRYQPIKGLMLRIGLTPAFSFSEKFETGNRRSNHRLEHPWLSPFIGIGWSL